MAEDKQEALPSLDYTYFQSFWEKTQEYAETCDFSQGQLEKLSSLADAIRVKERLLEELGLLPDEDMLVAYLIQVKNDIDTGKSEGTLSTQEAEKWGKKFSFREEEER